MKKHLKITAIVLMILVALMVFTACNKPTVKELDADIKDINAQLDASQAVIDDLLSQISELRTALNNQNNSLTNQNIDIELLESKVAALETAKVLLEAFKASATDDISSLTATITAMLAEIDSLNADIDLWKEALKEYDNTILAYLNLVSAEFNFTQIGETLEGVINLSLAREDGYTYRAVMENEFANAQDIDITEQEVEITVPWHGAYLFKLQCLQNDVVVAEITKDIAFVAEHYNLIYMNATLPVLLATADLIASDIDSPTYIALQRAGTYNWNYLPENTYAMPNQPRNAQGAILGSEWWLHSNNELLKARKFVRELYTLNNDSTFSINVADNHCMVAPLILYAAGVPQENSTINIYTDGTATSRFFKEHNLSRSYEAWTAYRNGYLAIIDYLYSWEESQTVAIPPQMTESWSAYRAFVMGYDDNVNYYTNTKDAILEIINTTATNGKEELLDIFENMLTRKTVADAFSAVEAEGKTSKLEFLLKTRWVENDEEVSISNVFANPNGKKALMILGTSVNGEAGNGEDATFMELFEYVLDEYGDEYNVFYKGHPSYPVGSFADGAIRTAFFDEHNIISLPHTTPAETYMYLYENVYIGGYYGSTFSSSKVGQALFFFGKEANIKNQNATKTMFDTEDPYYIGIFENSLFLHKSTIGIE